MNRKKFGCISLFSFLFTVYFILGYILTYRLQSTKYFDYIFSADIPRVWEDMTNIYGNHYRTKVHPFFPIVIYPIYQIFKGIFLDDKIAFVVLYSLIGTFNCYIFYKILEKFELLKYKKYLYTVVYGISFSSLIFSAIPETYLIATTFLLLLWNYAIDIKLSKREVTLKDYICLVLLGCMSYGITLTNFIQFMILFLYIFGDKKIKLKEKIKSVLYIGIGIGVLILLLTLIQNIVFPNITTFWDVITGKVSNEEALYMNFEFSLSKILRNSIIFLVYSIVARNIIVSDYMLYFQNVNVQAYIIGIFILIKMLISSVMNRKNNITLYLWLAIIFNFFLHNIYGSNDIFLFSQHYVFLILLIFAIDTKVYFDNKYIRIYSIISDLLILVLCFYCNLKGILKLIKYSQYKFGFISFVGMDIIRILLFCITLIIIGNIFVLLKRKEKYLLILVLLFALQLSSIKFIQIPKSIEVSESLDNTTFSLDGFDKQIIYFDNSVFISNIYIPIKTNYKGRLYQINNVIYAEGEDGENENKGYNFKLYARDNSLYIRDYSGERLVYDLKKSNTNDFFIFGMGRRNKYILHKNNDTNLYNLYDFSRKTNLYENISIDEIDAVNYSAIGRYEDKKFSISENENAVQISIDGDTYLYGEDVHINIPDFSDKKNRDILRILFNEVMVNITDKGPVPSLINYKAPFYRDAAIVAMFLNKTNNIDQIKPWIESINTMYDMQRIVVAEPDNLGQVLYLQSFLDNPNKELIDNILKEADRIATPDGMLSGTTDWASLSVYQTAWLKFGLASLGLDYSKWKLEDGVKDAYADTMWFYNLEDKDKLFNRDGNNSYHYDSAWQYLNYARAHFYDYDMGYIDRHNNKYPMSYEIGALQEELKLISPNMYKLKASAPHIWAAAEMYLYYIDR